MTEAPYFLKTYFINDNEVKVIKYKLFVTKLLGFTIIYPALLPFLVNSEQNVFVVLLFLIMFLSFHILYKSEEVVENFMKRSIERIYTDKSLNYKESIDKLNNFNSKYIKKIKTNVLKKILFLMFFLGLYTLIII